MGTGYSTSFRSYIPPSKFAAPTDTRHRSSSPGVHHLPDGSSRRSASSICACFPPQTVRFFVHNLIVPLIAKRGRRYSSEVLAKTFDWLGESARESPPVKLLVGRRKKSNCDNFDELCERLVPRGFEVIFPEDYSYEEQFGKFRSAEVIVGEDGSALHNAGVSRPGTHLVIYSRGEKVNSWHGAVAASAGLSLTYLTSPTSGETYSAPIGAICDVV